MMAEIISVGNELLSGNVLNTDTGYLSKRLHELGFSVGYQTVVPDDRKKIQAALRVAVSRSQVIVFTGGLGPTPDDITRESVCSAVGLELVRNDAEYRKIKEYFRASGRSCPRDNEKQAFFPKDAVIFPNSRGTAAGFAVSAGTQHILLLPGPLSELTAVFEDGAEEYLAGFLDEYSVSRTVNVFGIGESHVCDVIERFLNKDNPYVATYVGNGEVQVRVTARDRDRREAQRKCVFVARDIAKLLGDAVYGIDSKGMEYEAVELLKKHQLTVATAESCTAGLISKRITDVPGASAVFKMGVVAYSDEIKCRELFVRPETIDEFSSVSGEVAKQMAMGIKQSSGATVGLSVTGVAGPDSDERGNPVGLVFISMTDGAKFWTRKLNVVSGGQNRDHIRTIAAVNALDLLRRYLAALPGFPEGSEDVQPEDVPVVPVRTSGAAQRVSAPAGPAAVAAGEMIFSGGSEVPAKTTYADRAPAVALHYEPEEDSLVLPRFNDDEEEILPIITDTGEILYAGEQKDIKNSAVAVGDFGLGSDRDLVSNTGRNDVKRDYARDISVTKNLFDNAFPEDGALSENSDLPADDNTWGGMFDAEENTPVRKRDAGVKKKSDNSAAGKKEKKKRGFKGFILGIVPHKGDSAFEIVRKSIFFIALIALIVSAAILIVYYAGSVENIIAQGEISDLYGNGSSVDLEAIGFPEGANATDFAALYAENKDTVGWVKVNNTKVDNVVVQGDNNEYYLKHTFYGKFNDHGTIFMDSRCEYTARSQSQNLVLYGHHMNDGSMFASLKNLRSLEKFKQSSTISFNNLYGNDTYEIFGVFITNDNASDDNGYRFEYNKVSFSSDADFLDYVARVKERSIYNTGIEVTADDQLLTLSTCIYDFDDARLVIVGRRLKDGETAADSSRFTRKNNSLVVYPQAWYDKNGGHKPANALPNGVISSIPSDTTSSDGESSQTVTSGQTATSSTQTTSNTVTSNTSVTSSGEHEGSSQESSQEQSSEGASSAAPIPPSSFVPSSASEPLTEG